MAMDLGLLAEILKQFGKIQQALETFDPSKPPKLSFPVSCKKKKYQLDITARPR
jgi:hypothetical protein